MFIDTHAHLYAEAFDEDRHEVVREAMTAGVDKMLLPNIDVNSVAGMFELVDAFPQHCYPMIGLHPCSVDPQYESHLAELKSYLSDHRVVAIGEIGIDLYWDKTYRKEQEKAFIAQIDWAVAMSLPIVIHSRESIDVILDILEDLAYPSLTGVFHCFTGHAEQAKRILDLGFYMGLGGVLTFKKNQPLRDVVRDIPLERLILETDAPYLSPHPNRGKRNKSAYIPLVANTLATVKEVSVETVASTTTAAAIKLFPAISGEI